MEKLALDIAALRNEPVACSIVSIIDNLIMA
jgi:hypothetical protein